MTTTLPTAGQLAPSKTHAERRWTFVASPEGSPAAGVLTIAQGRRDLDSYAVSVEPGKVVLAKLDDSGDVYAVHCPAGTPAKCNCTGFTFKKTCKHADAARELIADGLIATEGLPADDVIGANADHAAYVRDMADAYPW